MATPAPCLLVLRAQVDQRWPERSRASDGIMGDARHRQTLSDHNQGNAIDLTHDPEKGFDVRVLADLFRHQMRHNPSGRITYMITNARISSLRDDWTWRPYFGKNPHANHLHISIKAARRNQIRPWNLG